MNHILTAFVIFLALAVGTTSGHADGDIAAGEETFEANCLGCHSIEQGGHVRVGPNLYGLFGATAGKRDVNFESRYSEEMKNSGIVWSEKTLDRFLESPVKMIPFTYMPFPGFSEKTDRDHVIAYLKSVTQ